MPDLAESWRQHVLDQAGERLDRRQGCGASVFGAEGHLLIRDLQQPGVGDTHPVGVAAEILDDVAGFAERLLDVGGPVLVCHRGHQPAIGNSLQFMEAVGVPMGAQNHLPHTAQGRFRAWAPSLFDRAADGAQMQT